MHCSGFSDINCRNRRFGGIKSIAVLFSLSLLLVFVGCSEQQSPTGTVPDGVSQKVTKSGNGMIGINVLLNTEVTDDVLAELETFGRVRDIMYQIKAVTMKIRGGDLPLIKALPFVAAANPDAERTGRPIDLVAAENFIDGLSTWDQDAINVTNAPSMFDRNVDYDGSGVIVGVLDTGLRDSWRQYFPQERIMVEYAKAFGGGGNEQGHVSEQPNKWEHDVISHGTHVTSTIIGYNFRGTPVNGVAPMAKIIPVKVLGNSGFGWSSVVARGIEYIADLKAGPLAAYPMVINMSLGGPALDAVEQAAIDYAISVGVIVCASAGNRGTAGMGYPGAYEPVISAAASGWVGEWVGGSRSWWFDSDVAEPINPLDFYITGFSSRELPGQDLDITAPGSWVVGPWQTQSGKISYFFVGGTSMSSPHVAGTVALMLEKNPGLTAAQVDGILASSAVPLPPDTRTITTISGAPADMTWGADATGAGLLDAAEALNQTP